MNPAFGKQHATPALKKEQEGACCLVQRNVNVNPFLFQTRIRTMKNLVLALVIHDNNVTIG